MMAINKLTISTTSTLEGYEVTEYLGVVTSHVVAGINVFRDILAGFSDFFGGRSIAYKKELSAIGNEAIAEMSQKALALGGNGLLGVRIDHDEISGQNKSMLMVTASGTAVVLKPSSETHGSTTSRDRISSSTNECSFVEPSSPERLIRQDELAVQIMKDSLLQGGPEGDWEIDAETWTFLMHNRVHELAGRVLRWLKLSYAYSYECAPDETLQNVASYLGVLPEEQAEEALYSAILDTDITKYRDDLIKVVDAIGLANYNRIRVLLQSEILDERLLALRLLGCSKRAYSQADAALLSECCSLVDSAFPTSEAEMKAARLSFSKEKALWRCVCDALVPDDTSCCTRCGRTRRGLTDFEERLIESALEKSEILSKMLDVRS